MDTPTSAAQTAAQTAAGTPAEPAGPPAVPAGPPADPAVAGRPSRRPRDLLLSLAVLLIPVVLMMGIYRVVQGGDRPLTVDAAATFEEARSAGDFPAAVPAGLAGGWQTLSARYVPGDGRAVLRVGYLSPSGAGYQLVESDHATEALLGEELTVAARPIGTRQVAGREWRLYQARPGERALVLVEPERTLIVVGSGPESELTALAASLRTT